MTPGRRNLARTALGATLIFMFLAPAIEPGFAQTLPGWNRPCWKAFKKYKSLSRHKAFAVSSAYSANNVQSCGWADKMASKAAAEAEAVRNCRSHGGSGCVIKTSE